MEIRLVVIRNAGIHLHIPQAVIQLSGCHVIGEQPGVTVPRVYQLSVWGNALLLAVGEDFDFPEQQRVVICPQRAAAVFIPVGVVCLRLRQMRFRPRRGYAS